MSTKSKTITEKISELDQMLEWFDSDDFVLEQATEQYKKAEALAAEISTDLTTMKNDVRVLEDAFDRET